MIRAKSIQKISLKKFLKFLVNEEWLCTVNKKTLQHELLVDDINFRDDLLIKFSRVSNGFINKFGESMAFTIGLDNQVYYSVELEK